MNRLMGCLVVAVSLLGGIGCQDEIDKQAKIETEKEINDRIFQGLSRPQENRMRLLSIKYGIPIDQIEVLVSGYLSSHDYTYILYKQMLSSEGNTIEKPIAYPTASVVETITRLSASTGVDAKDIASVIIDYESWNKYSDQ